MNWSDYTFENLCTTYDAQQTVENIVYLFFGVLALGMILYFCHRRLYGGFVGKLLKMGCVGEENARTLMDLGYFYATPIRNAIKKQHTLQIVVKAVSLENLKRAYETEKKDETLKKILGWKPDFQTEKLYIDEEDKYKAEIRFDRKGYTVPRLVVGLLVCALVFGLCRKFAPALLHFIDTLL